MIANPELAPPAQTRSSGSTPMRPTKDQILSIYRGITSIELREDLQGWNSDTPIFERLLTETQAKTVVEIGSWKGASVVHMANVAKRLGLDTVFYCVDFWQDPILQTKDSPIPTPWYQAPSAYQQFLYNVAVNGHSDCVIPVRTYSPHAPDFLRAWGVVPDLVYVDAGHTYEACLGDMIGFWPLLRHGGIMFGDDHCLPGVEQAVRRFTQLYHNTYSLEGYQWRLSAKA